MSANLLQGLEQASDMELLVLGVKLMAVGFSLALLAIVAVLAWSVRGESSSQRRTYLFCTIANAFAALYVITHTGVRVAALIGDLGGMLVMVKLAIAALMIAMAACICLYWVMEVRRPDGRPPWRRIAALYVLAAVAAILPWSEHPALVIASDRITLQGLSVFPEYGAAAPWYFALLLLVFAVAVMKLLRSPLQRTDRFGWRINSLGLGVLLVCAVHDALRELGATLLPLGVLWLGFVCFQAGAFTLMALHCRRLAHEYCQQRAALRRLSDALAHDRATGLYSRAHLQELLDRAGGSSEGGLLFIDLDHFKEVNDRYGHLCGDAVLRSVADLLRQELKGEEAACRWGGDEFLVYLPQGGVERARTLAARLYRQVHALRIEGAPELRAGLSMGYALFDRRGWRACAESADRALYQSKKAGRGQLTVAAVAPELRVTHAAPACETA